MPRLKLINITERVMAFEAGLLDHDQTVELFSLLVKSGLAWTLQGMYGRVAESLIRSGELDPAGNIREEN